MIESPRCRADATSSSTVAFVIEPMTAGVVIERVIEGSWIIVAAIPPGKTTGEECSLQPDHEYNYRAVAINAAGGRSDPSDVCKARTPAA
jgi:hypothetical protein